MITAKELYYKSIEQQVTHRKSWEEIDRDHQVKFEAFAYWANELFKEKEQNNEYRASNG